MPSALVFYRKVWSSGGRDSLPPHGQIGIEVCVNLVRISTVPCPINGHRDAVGASWRQELDGLEDQVKRCRQISRWEQPAPQTTDGS